jgi:hypothetical protein
VFNQFFAYDKKVVGGVICAGFSCIAPPSTKVAHQFQLEKMKCRTGKQGLSQISFIQYDLFARFNIRPNAQKGWQLVEVSHMPNISC